MVEVCMSVHLSVVLLYLFYYACYSCFVKVYIENHVQPPLRMLLGSFSCCCRVKYVFACTVFSLHKLLRVDVQSCMVPRILFQIRTVNLKVKLFESITVGNEAVLK